MKKNNFIFLFFYGVILAAPVFLDKRALQWKSVLFLGGVFLSAMSLFLLLKKANKLPVCRVLILIISSIFYLLNIIPFSTRNSGLSSEDVLAVLQTNFYEAYEYLFDNLKNIRLFSFIFLFSTFVFLAVRESNLKTKIIFSKKALSMGLLTGFFLIFLNFNNFLTSPFYNAVPKIKKYKSF